MVRSTFGFFGDGPQATRAAVAHLGYVQIDTINVVERCHHQILYTRIPADRREHLHRAQSIEKTSRSRSWSATRLSLWSISRLIACAGCASG